MPYSTTADLPGQVRTALPDDAQRQFLAVVNSQIKRGLSDSGAFASAWAAVGHNWKRPEGGGKWVHKQDRRSLYLSRPLENAPDVIAWAKAQGFKTAQQPGDMHVTVAYSKAPVEWPVLQHDMLTVNGGQRQVKALGDGGAVVLGFEAPQLDRRWQDMVFSHGASWDFPSYQPHVTLSWDAAGVDPGDLDPYDGPLNFGPEVAREIDPNWMANHTEKVMRENKTVQAVICKVDDELGLVFGWAIISKIDGVPYYDSQGDYIPEESMLEATTEFMSDKRTAKVMHVGDDEGTIVFAFPLTTDIAKAMGVVTNRTGLMIAMKPSDPAVLALFRDGTYTGFSIGGRRVQDEVVEYA